MNPISASSLLHFTKEMDGLKGILEYGFRFSYCCEEFSSTINMNEKHPESATFFRPSPDINDYVALPMICFCDIPLTRAKSHSDTYGNFIFGINKDIALALYGNLLNPILYRTSTEIKLALNDLSVIKAQITDVAGCHNYNRSINQLIGNTKPYSGKFDDDHLDYCFYDEREWRILMPYDYCDEGKWIWNLSIEDYKTKKNEINQTLHKSKYAYVGFTTDLEEDEEIFIQFISHIVVDTEEHIPELVEFILNDNQKLFGYTHVSKRVRNLLVSKITSFERIEKDF